MATRRNNTMSATTGTRNAGKPVTQESVRATRSASMPSAEDLDLRDRLKLGPRRQAGPPLVGDVLTRTTMNALRDEVATEPTDPKNRKSRS
jgi:hypothetical protein